MQASLQRWFPLLSNLIRGRQPDRGTITLTRQRIYILPTRQGLLFAVFLLAMLLGSINYALSLGFVLTFLLGGLVNVAMFHTYRNLAGLRIASAGVKPVFAGDAAQFQFRVETDTPRAAIGLRLKDGPPAWHELDTPGSFTLGIDVPSVQRGWLRPGRFTVFTVFPLGLFRAWSYVDFNDSALIYPRPAHRRTLPPSASEDPQGTHLGLQEGADDFAGLRPYRPGDSPRHVAWKAAGKSEQLLTKHFSTQTGEERWLDWAQLPDMDTEQRLSQLAGLVLAAEREGLTYGLRLPGTEIAPGSSEQHRHACLKALALFGNSDA